MTDAVSHAANSQSMVDAITQSAKAGRQVQKTNFKAAAETDQPEDKENGIADQVVKNARGNGRASDKTSVDKSGKNSGKPHHEDHDKDQDSDNSFEATIDKLGNKDQIAGATPNVAAASPPSGWIAELTRHHTYGDPKRGDESVGGTSGNAKGIGLPGALLKQDSIVALLDAKQRLYTTLDVKDASRDHNSGNSANAGNAALNAVNIADVRHTVADNAVNLDSRPISVTVQSQQSHWVFASDPNASTPRIFASLMQNGSKTVPTTATMAAVGKRDEKAQTNPHAQVQASAVVASDDATPSQKFDGQQQSAGSSRDQTPSADAGDSGLSNVKAQTSPEHVSDDVSDLPGTVAGATQQVRNGITNALTSDARGGAASTGPQLPQDRPAIPPQVLRSIDLTLSPPDLGTVKLKLSLTANVLDINAEASKASTAKLLDDDRKGLEQSLRDAGYDVKSLKITEAAAASNANSNASMNSGSSFQDGSQARANLSGRQDGNMPRRDGAMSDQPQQRSPRDDGRRTSPASDTPSGRQSNAVYI